MSNLYIRLKASFYTHRKTLALRSKIGDDALWIPPRLWVHAAEHQPDGDISGYNSETLAMLLGCSKHASSILQALEECGFIDSDGRIHGWEEHNAYHQQFSERAKKAAQARWNPGEDGSKEKLDQKKRKKKEDKDIEQALLTHSSSMLQAFRVRVGSWFKRRPESTWSSKELAALKVVLAMKTPDEDVVALEKYYRSEVPYRRKEPLTLLNNWPGEIDRAKAWIKDPTGTAKPGQTRPLGTGDKLRLKRQEASA